jgi:hypothetical protein
VANEPDYTYGGQWFDDMGSLVFSFRNAPMTGVDIARAGLTRDQANDMAASLLRAGLDPYEDEGPSDVGV